MEAAVARVSTLVSRRDYLQSGSRAATNGHGATRAALRRKFKRGTASSLLPSARRPVSSSDPLAFFRRGCERNGANFPPASPRWAESRGAQSVPATLERSEATFKRDLVGKFAGFFRSARCASKFLSVCKSGGFKICSSRCILLFFLTCVFSSRFSLDRGLPSS